MLFRSVSNISETGIREIYVSLKNMQIAEINKIRTFDKRNNIVYDDNEKSNVAERSDNYEHDLQENRELYTTKSSSTRGGESQDRQIWNNEVAILEREQDGNLRSNEDERNTNI